MLTAGAPPGVPPEGSTATPRAMGETMTEHEEQDIPEEERPQPADVMPTTPLTDPIRERLFKNRTLIISGEVNQKLASSVMAQLLALSADGDDPITLFINSQ